jgi:hypothetical protein
MLRTAFGLGVATVLLSVAGCRMCCHPYDYCGPVYEGRGCQSCSSNSRAGSILSGTPEFASSPEVVRRQVQGERMARTAVQGPTRGESMSPASLKSQVQGELRPGDVPGSEQIVSVTDRVVDPATAPSEPLPSKGWTARRPTPDVTR